MKRRCSCALPLVLVFLTQTCTGAVAQQSSNTGNSADCGILENYGFSVPPSMPGPVLPVAQKESQETSSPPVDATIIGPGQSSVPSKTTAAKSAQPASPGKPAESATTSGAEPSNAKPEISSSDEAKKYNRAGIELQSQGKLPQAIEEYKKAIELNPDSAAYHNNLALALKDMELLDEAEKEAQTAIKLKPDRGDYYFNLALVLAKMDRLTLACGQFRKAIDLNPHDVEARYRLSDVLMQLSRSAQAEKEIRQAIAVNQRDPRFHRLLADALMDQGKNTGALNEYKLVLKLSPKAADNHEVVNRIELLEKGDQIGSSDKSKLQ